MEGVGSTTHSLLPFSSSTKASKAFTLSSTLLCFARSLRSMGVEGVSREGALLGAAPSPTASPLGAEMSCCFSHSAHSSGLDSFRAFLASFTRRRGVKARTVTTSTKFRGDLKEETVGVGWRAYIIETAIWCICIGPHNVFISLP